MVCYDRYTHLGIASLLYSQLEGRKTHHASSAWTKKLCHDTGQSMPGKATRSHTWFTSVSAHHRGRGAAIETSGKRGGEAGMFSVESALSHWLRTHLVKRAVWSLQKGSANGYGTSAHWVNVFCASQTAQRSRSMVLLGTVACKMIHQSACQLSALGDSVIWGIFVGGAFLLVWFCFLVLFFFIFSLKVSPFPPQSLPCVALCAVAFVPATCLNWGVQPWHSSMSCFPVWCSSSRTFFILTDLINISACSWQRCSYCISVAGSAALCSPHGLCFPLTWSKAGVTSDGEAGGGRGSAGGYVGCGMCSAPGAEEGSISQELLCPPPCCVVSCLWGLSPCFKEPCPGMFHLCELHEWWSIWFTDDVRWVLTIT